MQVKGYYENEKYDLYDENGNFVIGGFQSEKQMENWCERNGYKLVELFQVIQTQVYDKNEN
jgi:hypothetical protein